MERSGRHCLGTKEGLRNSREGPAGSGPAHPPPEAEGREEWKGANSAPEMAPPTKLQTGSQFLTKDFLRFWMADICQEVAARSQLPRTDTRHTHPTSALGN